MVTLKKATDLDDFYNDMETPGGALTIPNRAVDLNNKRPISRTTEYWLTEHESNIVRYDPRVKAVELNPKDRGIELGENTIVEQTGIFARNSVETSPDLNWGLLRLVDGTLRTNWGDNPTEITTTINFNAIGRNVDLVICDGNGIYTGHPEFKGLSAQDVDDTSDERIVQYNWFQHDPAVKGTSAGNYGYNNPGSTHANHVMGTAGGNRQGWARAANLYNIYYYAGATGNNNFPYVMDYIREFHINKSTNVSTGIKNPTIVNNSWGMSIFPSQWTFSSINAVTYRGVRYVPDGNPVFNGTSGVFSSTQLLSAFTTNQIENISQRLSTSGSEGAINGDFNATPTGFTRSGGQIRLQANVVPNASYTATIQGPTTINYQHNVSTSAFSGNTEITCTITVQDSSSATVNTQTDTQSSTDGSTIEVDLTQTNLSLPNNEQYSITWETSVTEGDSPITAADLNCTIVNYQAANPAGTATSLGTNIPISSVGTLTASSTPTTGNNDDGYWNISLPFNVTYLSQNYNTVYLGTNSYLTFGGGSTTYSGIDENTPALPKIMVTSEDCSCQRIYYGSTGTVGSRIFRLVYEGSTGTSGTLGNPTVRYEYKFYEAIPTQIDLTIEQNANKATGGGFTTAQLNEWGFIAGKRIPQRVAALDADIEDLFDAGVVMCGAAGNGSWKHDVPGGPDWDNTFEMGGFTYYYMRGTSPTAVDNLVDGDYDLPNICVGATDDGLQNGIDRKVSFSDCGPGVDIYAPGTEIQSAYNGGFANDPRNSAYRITKISGTSMASPQVAGLLACILETYPHYTQEQAKEYLIKKWSVTGQLFDRTNSEDPTDLDDLQGSPNEHAKYTLERPLNGRLYPKKDYNVRPTTGALYPRIKRSVIKRDPEPGSVPASGSYSINVGNSGASAYTMSGSDRNGSVSGSNPTININSGDTLTLNVNASGHPLFIKTFNSTGTGNQVTGASGQGASNGTIVWNTTGISAGTYHYNCQFHGGMHGLIVVT